MTGKCRGVYLCLGKGTCGREWVQRKNTVGA